MPQLPSRHLDFLSDEHPTCRIGGIDQQLWPNREGVTDMFLRTQPRATILFVVITILAMTSHGWAHWYALGPSKDEWGLKYDGEVDSTSGDKLIVRFTLADQGKLKPIHSVFVMAFSNPNRTGTNLLKSNIEMKPTRDGKLTGEVVIGKEFADRAVIRIFTMTVDGRTHTTGPAAGARYVDIPLKKFLKKAPLTASSQSSTSIEPKSSATK
jgi:hypothetical protein